VRLDLDYRFAHRTQLNDSLMGDKGPERHEIAARLSWQKACELGFRGDLDEWQRLWERFK
jgi:hypothetical protein